jgi:4-amino-4-deoxy-L-arabinose transferase-like glycosyltransferase
MLLLIGAWAIGSRATRATGLTGAERGSASMLLGLCALAIPFMIIGSVSTFAAQMVLIAGVCGWLFVRARRETHKPDDTGEPLPIAAPQLTRVESLCAAVIGLALGLAFVSAIAPNTSWDAASAHLALAQDYNRAGRLFVFEGNSYSGYPQLLHTLYTAAYWNGGERAAGLLNWTFALLAVMACYGLGKRIGDRTSGLLGAALFATTPLFFDQAGNSGIDLPFAALVLGAILLLYAWRDTALLSPLILAGVLAGSSCGIRHTGYLVCALAVAGVLVCAKDRRVSAALVFAAVALFAAAPWLLRSGITTGNPAYPMFASAFGAAGMADDQSTPIGGHETVRQSGVLGAVVFPVDVVLRSWRYDGWTKSPGPMVLVLGIPGLLLARRRALPLGAFALAGAVPFYFFQRFARYVFPFYAPLFAVAGLAPGTVTKGSRVVWAVAFIGLAVGLTLGLAMTYFKFPAAFGLELRDAYLRDRVDRYAAFEWLNDRREEPGTVLTLDPRALYIDRSTYANIYALSAIADAPEDTQREWLNDRAIRYVFYPVAYVEESPVFAAHGLDALARAWLAGGAGFEVATVIETPRRDGTGTEQTYILERMEGE